MGLELPGPELRVQRSQWPPPGWEGALLQAHQLQQQGLQHHSRQVKHLGAQRAPIPTAALRLLNLANLAQETRGQAQARRGAPRSPRTPILCSPNLTAQTLCNLFGIPTLQLIRAPAPRPLVQAALQTVLQPKARGE